MHFLPRVFAASLVLVSAWGCGPGAERDDGGVRADAGHDAAQISTDGGRDAGALADAGPSDGGAGACGTARPAISSIRGTEGLVIARDGTLYFSQSGSIGRLSPDGTLDANFVALAAGSTVWGLTLDAANETLSAGVVSDGVYVVDLTEPSPSASRLVAADGPNGLAVAPDGQLYFSDFFANQVRRVGPSGAASTVTATPIPQANGIAFESSGTLLVASYATGELWRLTLDAAGDEDTRVRVTDGLGSPDGVALDALGRIYVTDNAGGELMRLLPDGTGLESLRSSIPSAASIEFGAGLLDCEDIYVASGAALVRYEGDAAGAAVPWH